MKKVNVWRIILSGILFAIVSQIIHSVGAFFSMDYYLMEEYFPVWSKVMMPTTGPPPTSFFYYAIGFGVITGIIYAIIYTLLRKSILGKDVIKRGLFYGGILFLVGGIPNYLSLYLLINLPSGLIIFWGVEGLVAYLLGGIVIAWLNE